MPAARILVVEDEADISAFIKRGLTLQGYAVEVAATGEDGLALFRESPADAVLLDLMLPGIDGVEVCRRLRAVSEDTPIIMLTALDSVGDKVQGLEAGADDYITKPFAFDELAARLAAALRRREPRDDVVAVGELTIRPASREATRAARPLNLTNREYDLLEYLARNAGKVVRKQTLFERVWGYEDDLDSDVIKVYIRYLRRKLNENGEKDMIHSVRGVGYMLKP